jgi:hypothetical protein
VSISVSQRVGQTDLLRTRYLHGIVSGVCCNGIFFNGKESYSSYVFTVESLLARLTRNRCNGSYYKKSVIDVISELLSPYEINPNFSDDYIKINDYSKNGRFEQTGSSDYDFLQSLLPMYGISYTFVHPEMPEKALSTAELFFSCGDRFPLPLIKYSDGLPADETPAFDFLKADDSQNIGKMDSLRIEQKSGKTGLVFNTTYPAKSYGNAEWKRGQTEIKEKVVNYTSLFHAFEPNTTDEEVNSAVNLMLDARYRNFELENENWTGSASNLVLVPGTVFELSHFYGASDNKNITGLVTASNLHVRSVWPQDIAVNPEAAKSGELSEVKFNCINYAGGTNRRFCRNI